MTGPFKTGPIKSSSQVPPTQVIVLNGRHFEIACAPGEGPRLAELAQSVSQHFEALQTEHGAVGEERLLLMTALTLADALADAEAARLRAEHRATSAEQSLAAVQAAQQPKSRARSGASTDAALAKSAPISVLPNG